MIENLKETLTSINQLDNEMDKLMLRNQLHKEFDKLSEAEQKAIKTDFAAIQKEVIEQVEVLLGKS